MPVKPSNSKSQCSIEKVPNVNRWCLKTRVTP